MCGMNVSLTASTTVFLSALYLLDVLSTRSYEKVLLNNFTETVSRVLFEADNVDGKPVISGEKLLASS